MSEIKKSTPDRPAEGRPGRTINDAQVNAKKRVEEGLNKADLPVIEQNDETGSSQTTPHRPRE